MRIAARIQDFSTDALYIKKTKILARKSTFYQWFNVPEIFTIAWHKNPSFWQWCNVNWKSLIFRHENPDFGSDTMYFINLQDFGKISKIFLAFQCNSRNSKTSATNPRFQHWCSKNQKNSKIYQRIQFLAMMQVTQEFPRVWQQINFLIVMWCK